VFERDASPLRRLSKVGAATASGVSLFVECRERGANNAQRPAPGLLGVEHEFTALCPTLIVGTSEVDQVVAGRLGTNNDQPLGGPFVSAGGRRGRGE
jgi:hypothetical protein